ncbi:MAG: paraquat-inducible protein A [Deltaproteobacteria bacterium]|nr:paraquat-inducible protein A [Deltaproteobacteria bacterium]
MTARSAGFALCRECDHTVRYSPGSKAAGMVCPRCGATVHFRVPQSLAKTWALTLTAIVFLIPANTFPIMKIVFMGEGDPSTIIDGVILLVHHDMIPIALIIFIASIAVPFLKITGIIVLLLSVQFKWSLNPRQCTVMYRMIEWIGRWSMIDIFVIAILVKLVSMGTMAEIQSDIAASFFGMAVVFTILAANSFDPRLLWDNVV